MILPHNTFTFKALFMSSASVKFLLLIVFLFGVVGGYYYLTTAPATKPVASEEKKVVQPGKPNAVNVSNVHLEATSQGISVTGQAANDIHSKDSSFRITRRVGALEQEISPRSLQADVLIDNGKLRSGLLLVDFAGLVIRGNEVLPSDASSLARVQIARVVTRGDGGTMEGTIEFRGIKKDFTASFTRDGNAIAGIGSFDASIFNLPSAAFEGLQIRWKLAIK